MAKDITYIDPSKLVIVGFDQEKEGSALEDERARWELNDALVRNIMVYGIQQPVLVRQEAGITFVVDGRQRVKAAREAAKRQSAAGEFEVKVPCIEVQADDNRVVGIMVSTNELRADDSVMGKARKASRLLDMTGDEEEVSLAFGRHVRTIRNWLKLLKMAPEVHEAIEAGKISANAALEGLAGKSRDEQVAALDQILTGLASPAAGGGGEDDAPTKAPTKARSDGGEKNHPGVKKGWLRKALKTEAGKNLEEENVAMIKWILEGWCDSDTWMFKFCEEAEAEIGE